MCYSFFRVILMKKENIFILGTKKEELIGYVSFGYSLKLS